jgi:hypothetical protein
MLSLFDPFMLLPFILFVFSSCRESVLSLASEIEVDRFKTSYGGDLVATLSSVSGYILALRQTISGCVPVSIFMSSFGVAPRSVINVPQIWPPTYGY